jgi:hypothetical protein
MTQPNYQAIRKLHEAGNPPNCGCQRKQESFEQYAKRMASNGFVPDILPNETDAAYEKRLAAYLYKIEQHPKGKDKKVNESYVEYTQRLTALAKEAKKPEVVSEPQPKAPVSNSHPHYQANWYSNTEQSTIEKGN